HSRARFVPTRARFIMPQVRQGLFLTVLLGLSWLIGGCQTALPPTAKLTLGPIAGGVTANSAEIWVRTSAAAQVQVQYISSVSLQNANTSATATTNADSDFTTIVKIPNLAPRQTYLYNVLVNNVPQFTPPYPQFQTFAAPGDTAPFRFVVLTDFRTV